MRRLPGPLRCKLSRETLLAYLTSLDAAPPFRLRKEMSTKVTLCFDGNLAAGSLELAAGLEALGRVELPTNGLGNRCSIHLSYRATLTVSSVYSRLFSDDGWVRCMVGAYGFQNLHCSLCIGGR